MGIGAPGPFGIIIFAVGGDEGAVVGKLERPPPGLFGVIILAVGGDEGLTVGGLGTGAPGSIVKGIRVLGLVVGTPTGT